MTVQVKTFVVFVANGAAGTVTQVGIAGQTNPALGGDPIIEVQDLTAGGSVTNFFGTTITSGGGNFFIVETIANATMAGHTCMALIGSR